MLVIKNNKSFYKKEHGVFSSGILGWPYKMAHEYTYFLELAYSIMVSEYFNPEFFWA